MGLFTWMFQWLGWGSRHTGGDSPSTTDTNTPAASLDHPTAKTRPRLRPERRQRSKQLWKSFRAYEVSGQTPYRFARFGSRTGCYLDLSQDGDETQLRKRGLPVFHTPEQLANWLGVPLNTLAWLVHRFSDGRPVSVAKSHYHYTWLTKRSGGCRLIESPKAKLKRAQTRILDEILNRIPAHSAAHGFVAGRSIVTNAKPHTGKAVVVKLDLANFYATVRFARVVAIFRSIGYSREAAIWLSLLTTTAAPGNLPFGGPASQIQPYLPRHLPQGAPTSPALANLSAYGLDVRLTGLAKSFGATMTRYADDIVLSGPTELLPRLRTLLPLARQIICQQRFRINQSKRRVLRSHQRQVVTGVVVNETTNVSRHDFDRLKAILTNCIRSGPSSQNRSGVEDFAAHLRGRIAHVQQLNPNRGEKLMTLYRKIDWRK